MLKFIYSTPINTMLTIIIAAILHVSAYWDSATSATVEWYQTERTCLYYQSPTQALTALECYDQPNSTIRVTIGAVGSLDGAYRPQKNGIYTLVTDSGKHASTAIKWRSYFPTFR